jgi:hypothetical protein
MPNALLLRLIFLRGTFRSNCCQPPVTSLRDAAPAHCPPICVTLASPSQSFHFKYITPEVGLALAALLVMVGGGPVEFGPSNRGAVWLPVIIRNLAKLHARRMGSPSLGRVLQRLGRTDDRPWCCVYWLLRPQRTPQSATVRQHEENRQSRAADRGRARTDRK